ncbi:hypothetical protein [Sunxiuqinia indica]|uniref:hypothetical protein n=1 Tax=Sunxiuqinia indica TaxID=2692584 RepID=UPI001358530D|nr:hypothetical protein [Sunxiuqinia indica]
MKRKEFIQKSLRLGVLTGLVGGSVFLIKRNNIDFTCSVDGVCKSCSVYSGCDLDKAKESRKDER